MLQSGKVVVKGVATTADVLVIGLTIRQADSMSMMSSCKALGLVRPADTLPSPPPPTGVVFRALASKAPLRSVCCCNDVFEGEVSGVAIKEGTSTVYSARECTKMARSA